MKKTTLLLIGSLVFSQIAFGEKWLAPSADQGQIDPTLQNTPVKKKYDSQENSFTDGQNEEESFSAIVLPTDMNKDGIEEIFIAYGNTYTSGMTGSDIVLFIKEWKGSYKKGLGFPGMIPDALSTSNKAYPDLLIGGPGFEFPVWRWNGKEYDFYKKIKEKDMKTLELTNIEVMSKQYQNSIRTKN